MNKQRTDTAIPTNAKIYIAGHRGMVGSAIIRKLIANGHSREALVTRTHQELDLKSQQDVHDFFIGEKIEYVVLAAAKVGGIHANSTYPAEFIYNNLMIQCNIIHEAYKAGIKDLLFLGSSCIYPKFAPQPMKEEHLLTGELEPTNEPYAIAKIAGIKMCESYNRQYGTNYRSVMPTNLYGPGDNYHLENSHVIPAMIRKYHLAKLAMNGDLDGIHQDEKTYGTIPTKLKKQLLEPCTSNLEPSSLSLAPKVTLWGTGKVYREFLHVDDMAEACLFIMNRKPRTSNLEPSFFNVGTGKDQSIAQTASLIRNVVNFTGETIFDSDKPDGTPKKLLDTTRIKTLGWEPQFDLRTGLHDAYKCYRSKH